MSTVYGHIVEQERQRQEAIARGEPDPFQVYKDRAAAEAAAEAAREPNRLEKLEAWMATDWEFGPYYWDEPDEAPVGRWRKVKHWAWWGSEKTLRGAEFVGEVVANVFGMNDSRFQYVIDAQREEQRREKQRQLENAQRRELAEAAKAEAEADADAARRTAGDVEA